MANKVIKIGSTQNNSTSLLSQEVYVDVSMKSKQYQTSESIENGNDDKTIVTTTKYRIDKLINVAAVQNSLRQIFTWIPGERVINPEFGSNLRKLLYEQITPLTEERIVAEIKSCVSRWEPRVTIEQVVNVSDVNDTEDNIIRLDIKYKIKGLDEVFTYTYEQNNSDI